MASRKRTAVVEEGTEAARRFDDTMSRVLKVSKEELQKREANYQKAREDKPKPGRRKS
jgi:hypothetical protein